MQLNMEKEEYRMNKNNKKYIEIEPDDNQAIACYESTYKNHQVASSVQ